MNQWLRLIRILLSQLLDACLEISEVVMGSGIPLYQAAVNEGRGECIDYRNNRQGADGSKNEKRRVVKLLASFRAPKIRPH
ncbi:MAG TPA: hypothetical protein VFR51_03535, partial [Pyrinomonadaceae bacterium]|nr:hypothetical protein [Pyrinomonadaceae bacterium]